ncbi:MAG TPA: DUF1638 domain-containing protein [Anaerolineales bacterium]|nr:DUF1638 domain-containing protein [Anaerolineales bacterium]
MTRPAEPLEPSSTAIVACGALAREVLELREKYGWKAEVVGVPVLLHNTPGRIPPAVRRRIRELRQRFPRIVVVYGDCGTAGGLDAALAEEGVERIAGPHCYEMYAAGAFEQIMAEEPGTFFLTDYLVGSFDHLVLENLGLDRYPELRQDYFGNYTRVVYLVQRPDPARLERARWAADRLGLPLEVRQVGLGALETRLVELMNHG